MLKAVQRALLFGFISLQVAAGSADDSSFFAARRRALMKKIDGSVAVLAGARETKAYTAFRQDNNFYYLTGVEAPDAFLLIDGVRHRSILFLPPRRKELERWESPRLYPGREAQKITGIDEVLDLSSFGEELERHKSVLKVLFTPFSPQETSAGSRDRALQHESARMSDPWDGRISRAAAFENNLRSKLGAVTIRDLSPILDDMRRVKDAQEIERLRNAGRIGALGMKEAIRSTRVGLYEYQVAALAEFVFLWHGASGFSFFPIVGSGPNSCILHYSGNARRLEQGDVVVFDFGPDYRYYQSDVTRTFPASGRFTEQQAKIYRAVLEAQKAAIGKVRPGATLREIDEAARAVLDHYSYARFLPHGVSHYIGMSAHDVGASEAKLEPGVVITVEPGVYMPGIDLGIRIEDTVLVTDDGCEVLTKEVPKEVVEIEKLMTEKGLAESVRD